jgi:YD repeat-containing protein
MRILVPLVFLAACLAGDAPALAATTYTYDDLGRVATVTYDNGLMITYSYDPAGNRTQVATQTSP